VDQGERWRAHEAIRRREIRERNRMLTLSLATTCGINERVIVQVVVADKAPHPQNMANLVALIPSLDSSAAERTK
jgi:hypothetical protein